MKPISSEEQKRIMLDILVYIDSFCKNNGINYFLVAGTLIGAIRHKGYIPWDDDIDIALLRSDYDKLCRSFNEQANNSYKLISYDNTKDYYLPYAKIIDVNTVLREHVHGIIDIGVNVDVFPLDYVSQDADDLLIKKAFTPSILERLIYIKSSLLSKDRSLWKNIAIILMRLLIPVPYSYSVNLRKKRMEKCVARERTERIAISFGAWGEKEVFDAEWFSYPKDVSFEGYSFSAPNGYDPYLKQVYGDYMKLPSRDKQISHHSYDAFWKE